MLAPTGSKEQKKSRIIHQINFGFHARVLQKRLRAGKRARCPLHKRLQRLVHLAQSKAMMGQTSAKQSEQKRTKILVKEREKAREKRARVVGAHTPGT